MKVEEEQAVEQPDVGVWAQVDPALQTEKLPLWVDRAHYSSPGQTLEELHTSYPGGAQILVASSSVFCCQCPRRLDECFQEQGQAGGRRMPLLEHVTVLQMRAKHSA